MRLARGSGLDGLAAMQSVMLRDGITWLRPLLRSGRAELRALLQNRDQLWIDDPTNEDDRFERARTRKALAQLRKLGIDVPDISTTAQRLAQDRDYADAQTAQLARACVHQTQYGELLLSRQVFMLAPAVQQLRLLRAILHHFGGDTYLPRHAAVNRLLCAVQQGQAATLAGVQIVENGPVCSIFREYFAVAAQITAQTQPLSWDVHWTVWSPDADMTIGALGERGLRQCGPRPKGLRANVALTLPAIWRGDELIAAAVLKPGENITFRVRHFASLGAPH
jgi:tRNA(Ile)-lysidine synthase